MTEINFPIWFLDIDGVVNVVKNLNELDSLMNI